MENNERFFDYQDNKRFYDNREVYLNLETMKFNESFLRAIHLYFDIQSSDVDVVKIGDKFEGIRIYVKLKTTFDSYTATPCYEITDVNFKENTISGFLDLDSTASFFSEFAC
jgi:hypothetical protein